MLTPSLHCLSVPAGGLSYDQMSRQMTDGYRCFLGENPTPSDTCEDAASVFLVYVAVNFFYNILLLVITKRGSAVLLVMSQALALPVTNIAFTLPVIMGRDAEPLSMLDLVGIVLVCIGFLTYSGYGLAPSFMVAQGPPGQMTYLHFEDQDNVLIHAGRLATEPHELADFLVGSLLQLSQQAGAGDEGGKGSEGGIELGLKPIAEEGEGGQAGSDGWSDDDDSGDDVDDEEERDVEGAALTKGSRRKSTSTGDIAAEAARHAAEERQRQRRAREHRTALAANRAALAVVRETLLVLEARVDTMRRRRLSHRSRRGSRAGGGGGGGEYGSWGGNDAAERGGSGHGTGSGYSSFPSTPEIAARYQHLTALQLQSRGDEEEEGQRETARAKVRQQFQRAGAGAAGRARHATRLAPGPAPTTSAVSYQQPGSETDGLLQQPREVA